MEMIATLGWLAFTAGMGLCVGSFTNVLIYRLPLGRKLTEPRWSACPRCGARIPWRDNLPVLSYALLGGRCRACRLPISLRYPVVELAVAAIFVIIVDALVVQQMRSGLSGSFLLSERALSDWPIVVAHLALFACLFAMSAIDIEHYWVDVRFTHAVTVIGFACHVLWTPVYSATKWVRPAPSTALVSLAVMTGLAAAWLVVRSAPWNDEFDDGHEADAPPPAGEEGVVPSRRWPLWLGITLISLMVVFPASELARPAPLLGQWRSVVPLALLLALIVASSVRRRPADHLVADAIEEERHGARWMALEELVALTPALLAGAAVWWWISRDQATREALSGAFFRAAYNSSSLPMWRPWQPLLGLGTAAAGFVIAGAMGWAVRIVFTLVFGKEAMGSGDIHLMAATGCVAGWPVVVVGFFLACFLAIFGWLAVLPWKRARAIPLGPWLAVAFLITVVYYNDIVASPPISGVVEAVRVLWMHQGG
ncbi:MAG: hypothetical protein C4547_14295 [Phycisphaerales bacterium]|nr:MAG: hypothetical protein C4547_14295 [Phycisphaerales bacterium]